MTAFIIDLFILDQLGGNYSTSYFTNIPSPYESCYASKTLESGNLIGTTNYSNSGFIPFEEEEGGYSESKSESYSDSSR